MAKTLLPHFGGAPAVWNTCMVFFQVALLSGYGYAYLLTSRLRVGRELGVHSILFLASLGLALGGFLSLPIGLPAWPPTILVLANLTIAIGLPFFFLSSNGPILQRWYSRAAASGSSDSYFLYGASNLGSFLSLLAYPFFWERFFSLKFQRLLWINGYIAVGGLVALAGSILLVKIKNRGMRFAAPDLPVAKEHSKKSHIKERLLWTGLAFIPSSLLLGVTTYLSTDVASLPLVWIVPLALYLLTFVIAFAKPNLSDAFFKWGTATMTFNSSRAWAALGSVFILSTVFIFVSRSFPAAVLLFHLAVYFTAALICHVRLARERPSERRSAEFYLFVGLGGALGGMFNALAAPLLFKTVLEYPLALAMLCLVRPVKNRDAVRWRWGDLAWPLLLTAGAAAVPFFLASPRASWLSQAPRVPLYVAGALCLAFAARPIRFGLAIIGLILASSLYPDQGGKVLHSERSFFGVHRVLEDKPHGLRWLNHGTTVHGAQHLEFSPRQEPLTYYNPSGPAGFIFHVFNHSPAHASAVGVIGLGTGSLLAYSTAGQFWTFFEIDPAVVRIARDARFFTFLSEHKDRYEVVLGDGRLSLESQPSQKFGLLVIDAFSSDSIPLHLLTTEAMELYLSKLKPDGFIAFHLSNRFLNLPPIVAKLAAEHGLHGRVIIDRRSREEASRAVFPSIWAVVAPQQETLAAFAPDFNWEALNASTSRPLWTDDASNILSVWENSGLAD